MYSLGLQVLRAKVRGFHAEGSTITQRISRSKLERKHNLWNAKRALGTYARHHMIAYGLLRGIPYERIERCAPNNAPDPQYVLKIMQDHDGMKHTLEQVKSLLTVPSAAAEVVAASEPSSQATAKPAPGPRAALGKGA